MFEIILIAALSGVQLSGDSLAEPAKTEVLAQIQTCKWPNKCEAEPLIIAKAEGEITTCQFPKKCG